MKATCRLTGDWLPLPADLLADLGWHEGDIIEIEEIDPDTALLTRVTAAGTVGAIERVAPPRGRRVGRSADL